MFPQHLNRVTCNVGDKIKKIRLYLYLTGQTATGTERGVEPEPVCGNKLRSKEKLPGIQVLVCTTYSTKPADWSGQP